MYVTMATKKTMKSYSIRCTKDEEKRIRNALSNSGYTLNSLAKTVLYRVTNIGMSDFKQRPGRVMRRGKRVNRTARLHFKLDPTLVEQCYATLLEAGFSFSEVLRYYLLDQKLLFSRPKKFRNRDSFDPKDFYQTPYPMTQVLASFLVGEGVSTDTEVLDPCCGHGAILDVLRPSFHNAWGFDKYTEFESDTRDFFEFNDSAEMIVTNPPFNSASEFIEHSMSVTETAWFLLPLDYLSSKGRYGRIFQNDKFYCSQVMVFTRSPTMTQEKQTEVGETGKMTYAWFEFSAGHGETKMGHFAL